MLFLSSFKSHYKFRKEKAYLNSNIFPVFSPIVSTLQPHRPPYWSPKSAGCSPFMASAFAGTSPRAGSPRQPQGLFPHFSPGLSPSVFSLEQCSLATLKYYYNHSPFPLLSVLSEHLSLPDIIFQWIIWLSFCPRINYFSLHKNLNFMRLFFPCIFGSVPQQPEKYLGHSKIPTECVKRINK